MKKESHLKTSRQRELILRILRSTHCHPTADWIYQQARKELPRISLATVYRNLKLLRDENRIQEMAYGKGTARYDADLRDHYHIRCLSCGNIEDLPHDLSRISSEQVEDMTGYAIHGHRLEYSGICPHCQDKEMQT